MPCCPLQLTASGGKRWMGQTLKWWPAQSTDGRPRWREQNNIYNQRDLTKRGTAIQKTLRSSIGGVSEEKKKNSSSDEARGQSCPTVDEVLTKAQFLSPLLYQIHCIGPVGFRFAHIYSERHPPQIGTLQTFLAIFYTFHKIDIKIFLKLSIYKCRKGTVKLALT